MKDTPFSTGEKVAGYFRDSGGEEQDLSVERQVAEFRRYLAENDLHEGSLFIDAARPGSTVVGRVGFQAMMRHFRSGEASEAGLVIWRSNRFGRNTNDSQFYKADIRRRGYTIYSLTDKIPTERYGQIIEYLLDWKDQEFLENLSEDVASGLHHIVETYGALPGTPPRGFVRQPVTVGKRRNGQPHILHRWVPDETMTPLVRRAYQMLLDGAPLVNIQTATGLYTSLNSWATFFRNHIYKGELRYKDIVIENYCEPVVDLVTWERAQRILELRAGRRHLNADDPSLDKAEQTRRIAQHPRRVTSPWMLSGLVRCAICGAPLNGHVVCEHTYYACSRAVRRRDCKAVKIPSRALEQAILGQIRDLLASPETLNAYQTERIAEYNHSSSEFPARRQELVARLENLHRQISHLTDAIIERGHSPSLLDKLTLLETQEYELNNELAQIDILLQAKPEPFDPRRVRLLAEHFEATMVTGTPEEQRKVLAGWIPKLLVERQGKSIIVYLEIYVPPIPGPDPPTRRRNVVQYPGTPRGHTNDRLKGRSVRLKL